ncbi:hypothetical protein MCETHM1_02730 [Flavobacteriaceae bacterium]|jgi:hypothetical protein
MLRFFFGKKIRGILNYTKHKYYIVQRLILIWRAIVKKATAPDIYRDADYSLKK